MIEAPINGTIPASNATAEVVEIGSSGCSGWAIQAVESMDFNISNVVGMTTKWTVKAGTTQAIDQVLGPDAQVCYVQSTTTTGGNYQLVKVRL